MLKKKRFKNAEVYGPLRKVVGHVQIEFMGFMVWREKLECGHLQAEKRDIYGPTNAERRRCRQCRDAANQEPTRPSISQPKTA